MYSFTARGHPHVTSKHKTTLEFTRDEDIDLVADCILGVKSGFSLEKIKEFVKEKQDEKTLAFTLLVEVDDLHEEVRAILNPGFKDNREIVLRKSNFLSPRTLGIDSDRSSSDFKKDFIRKLQDPKAIIKVTLS